MDPFRSHKKQPSGAPVSGPCSGFSIMELSIVLIIIGLIISATIPFMAGVKDTPLREKSAKIMAGMQDAVVGFALTHNRLPCPDTDFDGNENRADTGGTPTYDCTADVGDIPYLDLDLVKAGDAWGSSIRYAVYHNGTTNLANPTSGSDAESRSMFCAELQAAMKEPATAGGVVIASLLVATIDHVDTDTATTCPAAATDTGFVNQAYVLVSPGPDDADEAGGTDSAFDGVNNDTDGSTLCFEKPSDYWIPKDPGTQNNAQANDDIVVSEGFASLISAMNCQ
ncbi:MAG: prepilin-type N-terminal cleavage/methylation domain-containing protein [Magnetococcales bacterium]|nr:prepilin-type N-terminal cleavage/methylation domain-containing protein [Magnetococcales bacterium]MBF0157303.1 prepilin-type N-terminal cleavage/methylation domain-containing protein [Magnetococcales bacterium]